MGSYTLLPLGWSTYKIYLELFFTVRSDLCVSFIQSFIYINVDSLVFMFLVIIYFIYFFYLNCFSFPIESSSIWLLCPFDTPSWMWERLFICNFLAQWDASGSSCMFSTLILIKLFPPRSSHSIYWRKELEIKIRALGVLVTTDMLFFLGFSTDREKNGMFIYSLMHIYISINVSIQIHRYEWSL